MKKIVVEKKSSENKYLHRSFHISCDEGLCYLAQRFGPEGVIEYLQFAASRYYSPLSDKMSKEGLNAMKTHLEDIYETEEATDALYTELSGGVLHVVIKWCPAIRYMKSRGRTPSPWYMETTRTLYHTIAKNAGYGFALDSYDNDTGAAEFRFLQ